MAASTRLFAVLALALVASAVAIAPPPPPPASVGDVAAKTKNLSTLLALVDKANLTSSLSADFKGTVFAPTNKAFKALPKPLWKAVNADINLLSKVLAYHASATVLKRTAFPKGASVATLLPGQNVTLGTVTVGATGTIQQTIKGAANTTPSNVTKRIKAGLATIYVIDSVLLPL